MRIVFVPFRNDPGKAAKRLYYHELHLVLLWQQGSHVTVSLYFSYMTMTTGWVIENSSGMYVRSVSSSVRQLSQWSCGHHRGRNYPLQRVSS